MNIQQHMVRMRGGKMYLPVAPRVAWFREVHPDWTIETEALHIDWEEGVAMFRAVIRNPEGRVVATGTKVETVNGFIDFVEKSETGAIGRALSVAGFGTLQALDLDEGVEQGEVVDAPQSRPNGEEWEALIETARQRAEELGLSHTARARLLRRYQARTLQELSTEQLRDLLGRLNHA